ncbi:MAG: accessory gene regulator B family protein [Roseburia sp.]|nr:accessory gene regulator B family protein [Roseburia sp.]
MKFTYDYLVEKAVDSLVKENAASREEAEVYRFGVEVTLLKVLHLISYFAIALCMRQVLEFIIIFSIFCAFRRNTGGYHAKTRMGCYLFSCIVIAVMLTVSRGEMSLMHMAGLSICDLTVLVFISPVKNENRPLDEEEISYFRRRLFVLGVLFVLVFVITAWLEYLQLVWLYTIGLTLVTLLAVLGKIYNERSIFPQSKRGI